MEDLKAQLNEVQAQIQDLLVRLWLR